MSLAGRLADLSFPDLLQFVHQGGRSGTLWLEDEPRTATVTLQRGRIVGATVPGSRPLGLLLRDAGLITDAQRSEALARQAATPSRRSLDLILLDMRAVTAPALYAAVQKQIEESIYELVTWTEGTFELIVGRVEPMDCLSLSPVHLLRAIDINIQAVLLEGLRRLDERTHRMAQPPSEGGT